MDYRIKKRWLGLDFSDVEMHLRGDVVAGFVILLRRVRRSAELL
jgi:hypothetical protein